MCIRDRASDVVYSFNRCLESAYMQSYVEPIESVAATDDSTVVFTLKYPFAPPVSYTHLDVYKRQALSVSSMRFCTK